MAFTWHCVNMSNFLGGFWNAQQRWTISALKSSVYDVVIKSLSHVWIFCDPMDCSPPDSSVQGIFEARILEWVAISFSRGSSQPRDQNQVSHIAGGFFTSWDTREAHWHYLLYQRICLRCRRLEFNPCVRKIPWRREWKSTSEFFRGKSHGQRSLVGYSPWSCKESDMTEQLTLSHFPHQIGP